MEISCGIWVRGQRARESRFISRFSLFFLSLKKLSAERCFVVFISCSLSTLLKMWLRLSGSSAGWKRILRLMSALIGLSNVSSMDWLPSRRRHFWGIPADEFQKGEKKKKGPLRWTLLLLKNCPVERRPLLARPGCAGRIYSKWNTDEQLYASHARSVSLTISLSFSLSLCFSMGL